MKLTKSLDENIKTLKKMLPIDKSFDLIGREIDMGGIRGYLLFVDGFAKDDIMIHVMKELQKVQPEGGLTARKLLLQNIPYIETEEDNDFQTIIDRVLSGQIALFTDGDENAALLDAREYPVRNPSESNIEKVTRGPRDDLVETIVFNTALIRRRVRDNGLTFEIKNVGTMSKTDVAIGYINTKVDPKLLDKLRKRLEEIDVPALTMGEKSLEELLVKKKWYNPMPQFRVSERPDVLAAHLMEGHIIVLVDTSPTALILPSTLLYFTQYVEDYYQNPLVGTITRFVRIIAFLVTVFLVPLFLLLNMYPAQTPEFFRFLLPPVSAEISIFAQLVILEVSLELLRLSSLHTPQSMEAAFSIIGGLILGDFAVSMELFVADSIVFAVASTIANHCIPNPEMGNATKVFRWFLLLSTGFFGIWGFAISSVIMFLIICTTKTFDDRHHYLWPLIPFDGSAMRHLLFRYPMAKLENKNKKNKIRKKADS